MLVAFLLYNDGIQTIIRMASIYGAEIGIDRNAQIAAFVMVQFVGVPCSFLFGRWPGGSARSRRIFGALAVYVEHQHPRLLHAPAWQFFALAFLVGTVQGGSQALSRSLFARMIPKHKSSEIFGFFAVFEKFAGIAGPDFPGGMCRGGSGEGEASRHGGDGAKRSGGGGACWGTLRRRGVVWRKRGSRSPEPAPEMASALAPQPSPE